MSTRALYTFKDEGGEYHVYKHHDGYPTGALDAINKAKADAWELPRFEADEFAAAFIAANKGGAGGMRLTVGASWEDAAPGDIQYHYVVTEKNGKIEVAAYSTNCWDKPYRTKLLRRGDLDTMIAWAAKKESA